MDLTLLGLCVSTADGPHFMYDHWLVLLSYLVAVVGSYAALDMIDRLNHARGKATHLWLLGSATTLGGGIWSMHFIGMLAAEAAFPMNYDPWLTSVSFVIAVGACALGLEIVRHSARPQGLRLIAAGITVGIGVAAMHYTGMRALRLPGTLSYTPVLFGLSILIAIGAATAAFWLSKTIERRWQRATAALAMGAAIFAMHYVGMAATVIHFNPVLPAPLGLARGPLTLALTVTTIALLMLALVCDTADRSVSAASQRQVDALLMSNREIVRRLCAAGEFRDHDTGEHVHRLSRIAARLAALVGCDANMRALIEEAAILHDIGKIGIPDSILLKAGQLTKEERAVMQSHTWIGHSILCGSDMPLLDLAAEIALTHHERWDGSGYPRGLKGEEIPLAGRVVAVADVFDALLSKRPYKESWSPEAVETFLRQESARHFDPRLVAAFLSDFRAMLELRASETHSMRRDQASLTLDQPAIAQVPSLFWHQLSL